MGSGNWLRRLTQRMFGASENNLVLDATDTLQRAAVFGGMPVKYLRDLARMMHFRDYRRDEFVYHENDPGLGLYIVQQGHIQLITEDVEGRVHVLRDVREDELFGEDSLVGEFRRQETARVCSETRLLGFFRPDFNALIKRHPQAGAAIAMALAQHMAGKQGRMAQLLSVEEGKVAALQAVHQVGADADLSGSMRHIS